MKKVKDLIELSCYSVKSKINCNLRQYSFEIFGYDFIMDKDFNTYLLEVNTNPGYEESSPLIKMLIPRVIDDALRLSIDNICETKYSFSQSIEKNSIDNNKIHENENSFNKSKNEFKSNDYISPYPVMDYCNSLNLWDFVCDLNEKDKFEKKNNKKKYK
jgi:hypothetical protein